MIAVSIDADWIARLRAAAARGGWSFVAVGTDSVPKDEASRALLVLDRAAVRGALARTVAGLRARFPSSRLALSFSDSELGTDGVAAGLSCGADEVIAKSWPDEKVYARLAALRDAALADEVLISADGALKAERRAHRAAIRARGRWTEVPLSAGEFALLWSLLGAEPETASRERLLDVLRAAAGRDVEAETVSRRVLSLRRSLSPWKGKIESVRGGFYRLVSSGTSRRRSTT